MLRNATCLLIQDEENYYLTPYTDEHEEKNGETIFSLTNTLTAITIWPHKDEENPLDDVKKQLCLKFIELRDGKYASTLRSTSTVDSLMNQLDEVQKAFIEAVITAFKKTDNISRTHEGHSFSTDIVQVDLKNIAVPDGFFRVDKKQVNNIAFQHACLDLLKESVGWPAAKPLNADVTSGEIVDIRKLFHPFALQLNNTVHDHKKEAYDITEKSIEELKSQYQAAKESFTQFQKPVSYV